MSYIPIVKIKAFLNPIDYQKNSDFTRTGRRDIKGVLADGKISANRYYRRFKKDTLRQQCYDAMQLQQSTTTTDSNRDVITSANDDLDIPIESIINREETLKQMIIDCRKMFVCEETEDCFGTWLLIDDSDSNELSIDQTEPDCVLVLTSTRYFVVCYDETFQKVISFKETSLTFIDKIDVGPNPDLPSTCSWTLRIHYLKNGNTSGYYHQFRGTNVQVFNTTVMFLKDTDQINDYVKTIGHMIESIFNNFGQKSITLNESVLKSIALHPMDSLPDDVQPLQKRMSFSATDAPSLIKAHSNSTLNTNPAIDKIKNFGSRFSSMVTRQAAPAINKLTTQAKQLQLNETVASLIKVIGDSPSLIRPSGTKTSGDEERTLPTSDNSRKNVLQEKFDERKKELSTKQCQTRCFLLPSPEINIIYLPNDDSNST